MGRLINFEAIDRGRSPSLSAALAAALDERGFRVTSMAFPDRPRRDEPETPDLPVAQWSTGVLVNRYLDGRLPLVDLRGSFFRRPELASLDVEVRDAIAGDVQEMLFQAICSINRRERTWPLRKALAEHDFVFVSRWLSGYAYGVAGGVSKALIDSLEGELPAADLTFLLDVDPEVIRARRVETGLDVYEGNLDLQRRVRRLYLEMWREEDERAAAESRAPRIVRMDGTADEGDLTAAMLTAVLDRLLGE